MGDAERSTAAIKTPPRDPRRWAVLAVLSVSLLMVGMDATILNVALPSLIEDIRPTAVQQLWIIDGYEFALACLLITAGALGDRWGRKRLLLIGYALFGLGSVAAAMSRTPEQLIAARFLLAVGGAAIMPSTLSIIRAVFSDPRERATAIGIWTAVFGVGAAIGPPLGGFIVEHYRWGAAFEINVPVVLAALVAGSLLLRESKHPGEHPWDWLGTVQSIAGIFCFVHGVKRLGEFGPGDWQALVFGLGGLAILAWFVRTQLRRPDPMLDVRLFAIRPFAVAAAAVLIVMIALGAALLLVTQFLQFVEGFGPMKAGLALLPAIIGGAVGSLAAPWAAHRYGVRPVMAIGLALGAVGLALVGLAGRPVNDALLLAAMAAVGFGQGLALTAASTVLLGVAPPERAGGAAAIEEIGYELGIALGVAILGSASVAIYRARLPAGVGAHVRESIGSAVATHGPHVAAAKDAFTGAMVASSLIAAALVAVAAVLAAVFVPRGFRPTE